MSLDLNHLPALSKSVGSSINRVVLPPSHEEQHTGSDNECIAALNDFDEQRDWDVASEEGDVVSDEGTVLVENSLGLHTDEGNSLKASGENEAIEEDLYVLGKLFEMEGLEEKRCKAILERVNLNFGENGKCVKKRRVDNNVEELGINGEEPNINGD